MKFGQVGGVQGLISKHTINGKVLHGLKLLLLAQLVEHAGSDCCSVGAQDVLLSLLFFPVIPVTIVEWESHIAYSCMLSCRINCMQIQLEVVSLY